MTQTNLNQLPPNLPRPTDDAGARHLKGLALPDLALPAVKGTTTPADGLGNEHVPALLGPALQRPPARP